MSGTTANYSWPYPENTDHPYGATQIQDLADAADASLSAVETTADGKLTPPTWSSYTPAWEGTGSNPAIGNGTLSGKYIVIGKFVHAVVFVLMGSTTTYGSGTYWFGLPAGYPADDTIDVGVGHAFDSSAGALYTVSTMVISTTRFRCIKETGLMQATYPVTWANADRFQLSVSYETST